jgi:hypothetical protein
MDELEVTTDMFAMAFRTIPSFARRVDNATMKPRLAVDSFSDCCMTFRADKDRLGCTENVTFGALDGRLEVGMRGRQRSGRKLGARVGRKRHQRHSKPQAMGFPAHGS